MVLSSDRGSALARVTPDKRLRLVRGDREAFGIHGRSAEQRIALDMLLDHEVGIVGMSLLVLSMLIMLVLGPPAISQARQFSREIPQTVQQFYDLPFVGGTLRKNDAASKVQRWINDLPANVSDQAIANTASRLLGGVFSILPILGLWMLPLGVALIAFDVPFLQRPIGRLILWIGERWLTNRPRH